jgi:DNA-directed RNA polymerase subunit L
MSSDLSERDFKITDVQHDRGSLEFVLSGTREYGLDKSIANAIRRTLLNDIPTVAFECDEGETSDLTVVKNDTSLHNEMMVQRVGLLPIYLNPDTYLKDYLFVCNVVHDKESSFQFVSSKDFKIYPLKTELQKQISDMRDESIVPEDPREYEELLNRLHKNLTDNYDLTKPLNRAEMDEILRPYEFRGDTHYCLLNELKNTNTGGTFQSLHFYGSPSVNTAQKNSRYQAVSQASYTFLEDEQLIKHTLEAKMDLEKVPAEDREQFSRKFQLGESARYFHRDISGEAYRYHFRVKSCHYYDSGDLVKKSLEILMNNCDILKGNFLTLLQDKPQESSISVKRVDEYNLQYTLCGVGHTMGNLLQNHIVRRCIHSKSILSVCGYKKPHPLEDLIVLYVSVNQGNKIRKETELRKFQMITTFIMDQLEQIKQGLKGILDVSKKSF